MHAMISALSSGRKGPNPRLYLVSAFQHPYHLHVRKLASPAIAVSGHPADKRKKLFLLSDQVGARYAAMPMHATSCFCQSTDVSWTMTHLFADKINEACSNYSLDQLRCQRQTSFSSGNFSRASVPPCREKCRKRGMDTVLLPRAVSPHNESIAKYMNIYIIYIYNVLYME